MNSNTNPEDPHTATYHYQNERPYHDHLPNTTTYTTTPTKSKSSRRDIHHQRQIEKRRVVGVEDSKLGWAPLFVHLNDDPNTLSQFVWWTNPHLNQLFNAAHWKLILRSTSSHFYSLPPSHNIRNFSLHIIISDIWSLL